MHRTLSRARLLSVALVAVAISAAVVFSASAATQKTVVKVTKNAKLHETILVNRQGLTLYSLSAEKNGRFICTDTVCLSVWKPLVVPKGTKPAGAPKLATIRRPDGRIQVTYRGLPLYTFVQDKKPGDTKGNGFKDVGTWRPATPQAAKAAPPSPPAGYGGYGGYGG